MQEVTLLTTVCDNHSVLNIQIFNQTKALHTISLLVPQLLQ